MHSSRRLLLFFFPSLTGFLKQLDFADLRRGEQLGLRSQQRIVATVEDSVLRTEISGLESQEEDAPKRRR